MTICSEQYILDKTIFFSALKTFPLFFFVSPMIYVCLRQRKFYSFLASCKQQATSSATQYLTEQYGVFCGFDREKLLINCFSVSFHFTNFSLNLKQFLCLFSSSFQALLPLPIRHKVNKITTVVNLNKC